MLPIYNANELKAWDQFTIQHQGIESINLMERAANQFASWFTVNYHKNQPVIIFCGNGNNGGDGLAIARLLAERFYNVMIVLIKVSDNASPDYLKNLAKLKLQNIEILESQFQVREIIKQLPNLIVIDAILGYGLNKAANDELSEWFQLINKSMLKVISIDLPSGMFVDKMTTSDCVHANYTYTFQNPKLCHLIPETGLHCGTFIIGNIDLDSEYALRNPSEFNYVESNDIKLWYKPRDPFGWKNKYGHLLIIGGNKGMAGAILLSTSASLRSGCGLCSIRSVEPNREIIQMSLPEAIYVNDDEIDYSKYSSIVIGPGMGMEDENKMELKNCLRTFNKPIVLDADALNIIAKENWHSYLSANCILTPHVGEFDRLFGVSSNGFERLEKAIAKCAEFGIHIILKGKYTAIVCPDKKVYFNSTGNPGLAKGGSGDVLSGMLGSFLAQGYSILDACIIAVYLHGLAADIAKEQMAEESIFPTDVIKNISNAFMKIKS